MPESTIAIAVLCDTQAVVRRVLYCSWGDDLIVAGQPLENALDSASHEKLSTFLRTIRENGAAYDWEMYLATRGDLQSLCFSGNATTEGFFIAAAMTRDGVTKMFEQFQPDQANSNVMPTIPPPISPIGLDSELYTELARLNNELVTTQRELIKRNIELEKVNEFKNQFIGIAAHDLRNPLQVIQGSSQLLLDCLFGELTPKQEQFISVIRKNSDFMLKLITDLLYISKIEAGKLQLVLEETDVITLLERNIELSRLLAEQKQITLTFVQHDELPPLFVDALKIEQVLNNLIHNAVKFSHPNTTIEISATKAASEVVIRVRDEGQGIPADEIDRLFIPFENLSVKSTAGEPSTGLGLAIVKRIIEGHKGRIWVESKVGVGSTFSFSLPLS